MEGRHMHLSIHRSHGARLVDFLGGVGVYMVIQGVVNMWRLSWGKFHPGKSGRNLEIAFTEMEYNGHRRGRVLRMRRSIAKTERNDKRMWH
ncbi:hypothetical protein PAXRUDRAFT_757551 [Paxillus rubicundulus Ve08.2h10]|uniref:Uncharacterized protein n=1 Tax=Paxillus rubicundulus Ve08.2h10 TaxID=930991 RepID=A0A0D0DBL5_9AGAM|nr:hypothetical protein PAXRUDRAFT_757551 [Paxillus rubicundulus Ve08.2h10]